MPAPSADPAARTAVINELSALAQSVWFTLLGALAFLGIVLLSTTDADFLLNSSETELPLVRIAVPTERFFFLAPIVTTVLYLYLHFFCLKLWAQFCARGALADGIKPTLINDLARHLRPDAKPRGGLDWAWVSALVTGLLIWAFHPALLVAVIWKSGAASGGWDILAVRGMALACLVASLAAGLLSLTTAPGIRYPWLSDRRAVGSLYLSLMVAGALAAWAGGRVLTERLPTVDVDRANLVALGPDWQLAAERREAFRIEWCGRERADLAVCGLLARHDAAERARIANLQRAYCLQRNVRVPKGCRQFFDRIDAGFAAAWSVKRRSELNRLPELDLSGRDLALASAVEARLVGARLEKADLSGTRLVSAQLEGAILIEADLEDAEAWYASFDRANLTGARLARANFTSSSLEGATLPGAVLSGASLTEAQLADADLAEAQLVGADLSRASLRRAELRDASLTGAVLDGADLSGARNLTQDQLAHAVGDADTLLPAGLRVKGCWPKLPARAQALVDLGTLPEGVADVLAAHVCAKGVKPALVPPAPLAYPTEPRPEDRQAARDSVAREAAEDKRRILALTAAPGAGPAGLMPRPRPAGQPLRLAGR